MGELYVNTLILALRQLTCSGEHRIFDFTPDSTAADAHLQETKESRSFRDAEEREHDPHVLEELIKVSSNESQG